jgi:hypothetical protein
MLISISSRGLVNFIIAMLPRMTVELTVDLYSFMATGGSPPAPKAIAGQSPQMGDDISNAYNFDFQTPFYSSMIKISLFFINSRSFSRSEHCFVCGE